MATYPTFYFIKQNQKKWYTRYSEAHDCSMLKQIKMISEDMLMDALQSSSSSTIYKKCYNASNVSYDIHQ